MTMNGDELGRKRDVKSKEETEDHNNVVDATTYDSEQQRSEMGWTWHGSRH